MKKTLNADEQPLYKVFSDEYLFTIPSVQRPYSWTEEEAGELLDDLLEYIDQNDIDENNIESIEEPYFLGSIVLVKEKDNRYEVLDGQQRLTTITILLAVLRDYLGGNFSASIKKLIAMEGDFLMNTKDRYRLELRKIDQDFFKKFIQTDGGTTRLTEEVETKTDSQKWIRNNARYFINKLNDVDSRVVQTLPRVIPNLCYLVLVSTINFDSAFRIFTVLNDRGLDLLSSDIIKARAIDEVPEDERDDYTRKWEETEVALGRDKFNKLFEHIRMIIQQRKGGRNLKDEYSLIFKNMNGKTFIDNYLIPYSEIYIKLIDYEKNYKNNPDMLKLLSLIHQIDNVDWLTIAMYYIYHNGSQFEHFMARLEMFAGASMMLRKNFNWRMSRYSRILHEMEQGIDMFSEFSSLEISNEDKKHLISLLNGDIYNNLKPAAKRYLLLRLDSLLTKGQPYYNYSVITVEHVLPQSPKPGSYWMKQFEQPENYVHKLGNLVLLTRRKNSKAKNFDFDKKKNSYFQDSNEFTTFALTLQVIQQEEWSPQVIMERQNKLIKLLKKAWNLEQFVKEDNHLDDSNFYIKALNGLEAEGYPTPPTGFTIMKGACCSVETTDSIGHGISELRRSLLEMGILQRKNGYLRLTEDYNFSSPSAASSVVLGRSSNGLTTWKQRNGKTLKEAGNS